MPVLRGRGGDVHLRDASVGAVLAAEGALRGYQGGVAVTGKTMGGLPAANLAIQIASEAVAKRKRIQVWRGDPPQRTLVKGTWQARFFAGQPNERDSWFSLFEQTEASLTARNNGYWLKLANGAGQVESVYVVHPDNAMARWNRDRKQVEYRVRVDDSAQWSEWLTSAEVLHFRVGYPEPGQIVAPSPVQRFREALTAALAKARFEGNFYESGLMQSLAVTFGATVSPEQARKFRDLLMSEHGGIDHSSRIRIFGGGATVAPVGLSLTDAQFIEGMNFDVQQIGRIFNVTASLLGMTSGAGSRREPTPEHEEDRWWRYGLEPRLARIEETILHDPSFFGPAARDYPEFATARLRADRNTEVRSIVSLKQAGIVTGNTAAAELGYPGVGPEGDVVQVTPVGGAPNDAAAAGLDNQTEEN